MAFRNEIDVPYLLCGKLHNAIIIFKRWGTNIPWTLYIAVFDFLLFYNAYIFKEFSLKAAGLLRASPSLATPGQPPQRLEKAVAQRAKSSEWSNFNRNVRPLWGGRLLLQGVRGRVAYKIFLSLSHLCLLFAISPQSQCAWGWWGGVGNTRPFLCSFGAIWEWSLQQKEWWPRLPRWHWGQSLLTVNT